MSSIDVAKRVLKTEAEAVEGLIARLGPEFDKAVEVLQGCEGRIVVTGMGKTGIIGRKISATFASIGVPSFFMSAAEARHGDMGMVEPGDVVLAISNSGETEEVVLLLPTVKEIGARLIALTGNAGSTLARYSDVVLDVGVEKEACPLGLVPTSSTTASLAMGDALAVALIERTGLNAEEFAAYHPGGSLGKRFIKVKDVMRCGGASAIVRRDAVMKDVLLAITAARAGAALVVDEEGVLAGIFTDGDLRRSLERHPDLMERTVDDFMVPDPVRIGSGELVVEALKIMRGDNPKKRKLDEIPVVDRDGKPLGILDVVDLISYRIELK